MVQPQKTKKKQRNETSATDSTAETTDQTTSSTSGSLIRVAHLPGSSELSARLSLLQLMLVGYGGVRYEAKRRGHRKIDVGNEKLVSSHRKRAVSLVHPTGMVLFSGNLGSAARTLKWSGIFLRF